MRITSDPDRRKGNFSIIYLDNNATTPLDPAVREAMLPYLGGMAGNASSRHSAGRWARKAIDKARRDIADCLDADPEEIFFTSGATEANNWAILSNGPKSTGRVLVSPADHPSAIEPARILAKSFAWSFDELTLDADGRVTNFRAQFQPDARLAIIQLANSETGCIQEVGRLVAECGTNCRFHCDAVQAVGKIPVRFHQLGVASLAISGHKLHGPTGVGALIVRKGFPCPPRLFGGHQEGGFRPGTEPIAAIVGLATAVRITVDGLPTNAARLADLRDRLENRLLAEIPDVICNSPGENRLPNVSNLSFLGVKAETLLIALDLAGVCCSAGTACASGSLEPSPVLRAMGVSKERLDSAIRFSVGRFNTTAEIDDAAERISRCVKQIRSVKHGLLPASETPASTALPDGLSPSGS